jgi:hypothetical protein
MKDIRIDKADEVGGVQPETTIISIDGSPQTPKTMKLDELDQYFQHQAEELEHALFSSLPGGTYDRLAGKMMIRKASNLLVRLF